MFPYPPKHENKYFFVLSSSGFNSHSFNVIFMWFEHNNLYILTTRQAPLFIYLFIYFLICTIRRQHVLISENIDKKIIKKILFILKTTLGYDDAVGFWAKYTVIITVDKVLSNFLHF